MAALTCAQVHEVAPDLALGLLAGPERAAVLEHLQGCRSGRAALQSLAEAADEILLLAADVEPPAGFEARVLARLGSAPAAPAPPRRRRSRLHTLAAVAAAVVLLALGGVLVFRGGGSGSDVAVATAEMRTGAGELVGHAQLRAGAPASVVVDLPGWAGLTHRYGTSADAPVQLAVERRDGQRDLLTVPSGADQPWQIPVGAAADQVVSVAVVDAQGRIWCSARFD